MVFYFSCALYLDGEVASARSGAEDLVWAQHDGNAGLSLTLWHVAFGSLSLGNWMCLSTFKGRPFVTGKKEGSRAVSLFRAQRLTIRYESPLSRDAGTPIIRYGSSAD